MLPLVFWLHCRVYPLAVSFIFLVTCFAPVSCSRATALLVFFLLGPPCCSDSAKSCVLPRAGCFTFSELAWRRHLALTPCFPTLLELPSRDNFLRGQTSSSRDLVTEDVTENFKRGEARRVFQVCADVSRCRGDWTQKTATSFQWAGGQTGQVPHGKVSNTWTSSTRTFRAGERRSYRATPAL